MDAEERENGITFGEICHLIGKKIWWILGGAAAFAVVVAVLFALVFNPLTTYYSMSFELVYPTSAERQYPDGTPFSYRSIISRTMLEAAKKKDERLAGTDVVTMIDKDHISVSAQAEEDSDTVIYTVNVKGSYFSDIETAQLFIRSVADATVDDIMRRAASVSYSISEETFTGNNFEARLDILSELYKTLLSAYESWITTYSAGYQVTVNGVSRSLSDYRAEVYGLFVEGVCSSLATECENNGYGLLYGDEDEIVARVSERVEQLQQEYRLNQAILEALTDVSANTMASRMAKTSAAASGSTDSSDDGTTSQPVLGVSEMIAYYSERNAVIANQLGAAVDGVSSPDGTLTAESAQQFARKLDDYFAKLNSAAETLKSVTTAIYRQNTFAEFVSQNADSTGDFSVILIAVAAFVIAFLVAAVAVSVGAYGKQRGAHVQSAAGTGDPADSADAPTDGARAEDDGSSESRQ